MMERAQTMAFAAGALVFPGGRIEADDHEAAAQLAPDLPRRRAASRRSARRSRRPGSPRASPCPAPDGGSQLRPAPRAGEAFAGLLAEHGLTLDLAALTPFARWCPNFRETRRFDTLFYLAEAPAGAHLATADAARRCAPSGRAPPTCSPRSSRPRPRHLPDAPQPRAARRFASIEEARADAARHPVRKITPWVEERDGRRFVCIPDDAGYPVTAEPLETARRR
jgi:hypothetical protein